MKLIVIVAFLLFTASAEAAERKRFKRLVLEPIDPATCAQIRNAVASFGVAIVEAGAAARGFTRAQITSARAQCL